MDITSTPEIFPELQNPVFLKFMGLGSLRTRALALDLRVYTRECLCSEKPILLFTPPPFFFSYCLWEYVNGVARRRMNRPMISKVEIQNPVSAHVSNTSCSAQTTSSFQAALSSFRGILHNVRERARRVKAVRSTTRASGLLPYTGDKGKGE